MSESGSFNRMCSRVFESPDHAQVYHQYRPRCPRDVLQAIMGYATRKSGILPPLAVDVGCGSGQATLQLAEHCGRVLGVDASCAQVGEATAWPHPANVSFVVGEAESLPVETGSVWLLSAFTAAHWFNLEAFGREASRVLAPRGCMALYSCLLPIIVEFGQLTDRLSDIFLQVFHELEPYENEQMSHIRNGYADVYDAIPFADKERFDNFELVIPVMLENLMGIMTTFSEFQELKRRDPTVAQALLNDTRKKFKEVLGDVKQDVTLTLRMKCVVLLACKSSLD